MSDEYIPTSRSDPVRTFVSYVLSAIVEVCPHLHRLVYHRHLIGILSASRHEASHALLSTCLECAFWARRTGPETL